MYVWNHGQVTLVRRPIKLNKDHVNETCFVSFFILLLLDCLFAVNVAVLKKSLTIKFKH